MDAAHRYTASAMKSFFAILLLLVASILTMSMWIIRAAQPAQSRNAGALTIEHLVDIRHPSSPVWSPDGQKVAFLSDRAGISNIFVADAGTAGSGTPPAGARALTRYADGQAAPFFWSADGRRVYFTRQGDL